MVLKDWKKSKVDDLTWYKKIDDRSFVTVWRIGLSSHERKKRGIGLYGVKGRLGMGDITKRTFKTKSMALKFAKAYRRKN